MIWLLSLLITPAYAAQAELPIVARIVQVEDLEGMLAFCDERGIDCSHLADIEPAAGDEEPTINVE